MPKKETSPKVSTLAAKVLADEIVPTAAQIRTLAAAALANDETKGQDKKAPKPAPKPASKAAPKPAPRRSK